MADSFEDSTTGAMETIDYAHHEIHSDFVVYSALMKDNAGVIEAYGWQYVYLYEIMNERKPVTTVI